MSQGSRWIGFTLGFGLPESAQRHPLYPWWWRTLPDDWLRVDGRRISFQENPAEVDRMFPLPRPPVRAGQVWVWVGKAPSPEPPMFAVTLSGPEAFVWAEGELIRRADTERIEFLLAGWCLVSGPGAPWAAPLAEDAPPR